MLRWSERSQRQRQVSRVEGCGLGAKGKRLREGGQGGLQSPCASAAVLLREVRTAGLAANTTPSQGSSALSSFRRFQQETPVG